MQNFTIAEKFTNFQSSLIPLIDKKTGFFNVFDYTCKDYVAEWDSELIGYVFTFTDGKNAQAQVYTELDKLHGNYDEKYLERHIEYDDDLSDDQEHLINNFIEQLNFVKKTINDNNIYPTD